MSKYNGWANYATWRINLELFDSMEPEHFGLEPGEELKLTDLHELADAMKDQAESIISEQSTGIAESYALAFLSDVDWYEIAKHFVETYAE